ncbi:MAG: hypothetical protein ACYDDV_00360 [Methanoregula sp.]
MADIPIADMENSNLNTLRRHVESHLRKFMKGKKSLKTLENAKKVIAYFEVKGATSRNAGTLSSIVVRRSEIVRDLVEGRGGGKSSVCPDCIDPKGPNCPFTSGPFKNENTLNRLLNQLAESKILKRIERKKKYARSSPFKERPDVFYRIDARIYTKMVTEADEIEFLHDEIDYYSIKQLEAEHKLSVAYDLLKEHSVKDPERIVEKRAEGYQIISARSFEDLQRKLNNSDAPH